MTGTLKQDWINRYYFAMAAVLERFVQKYGVKIYFFPEVTGPSQQEDDRMAARRVVEMMKDVATNIVIVDEPVSPSMLKGLYGLMDILLPRGCIRAVFHGMGIPTLFIGYLTKIRGMVETIGLEGLAD